MLVYKHMRSAGVSNNPTSLPPTFGGKLSHLHCKAIPPPSFALFSMESDSDSDSSHISATPPRNSTPLPPTILHSSRTKSRVTVSSFSSKPKHDRPKRNKPYTKTQSQPSADVISDHLPSPDLSNISGLPIRIHQPSILNPAISAPNSIDQLPAGYFSKSTSFSTRFKSRCPSFEPTKIVNDLDSDRITASLSQSDAFPPTFAPTGRPAHCVGAVKSHPNSISVNVCSLPVKRPKIVSEGNFVRLNINGYGRKFGKKGGTRKYPSYGRKSRWRGKHKSKPGSEIEKVSCNDNGLVSKNLEQIRSSIFNCELINQSVRAVREDPSDHNLKNLLKLTHGHDSFREGQLEAIKHAISGQSTMLVLPTGAGKSLCYQLPALILPGITLVVSPLVALMVDQLRKLPPMLHGGLLCSSQTNEEASEMLDRVCGGNIKVLFVSPERFLNPEFLSKLGAVPHISLMVVDEAHCLSEWSHNFRPSYLRLRALLLRTKLNVECFLAMTATATTKTLHAIMCALEIPSTNLIQASQVRENLQLNVMLSGNRMKDLIMLMRSSPLAEVKSIIVYCKFQSETDLVSKHLCDNNIPAKSYHSGIPATERNRIQELFCSNKIRVVVATVAFGMGLDKSDVGAVIHYSLPESLEEYVQETGRAGRDGRLSYCHLLLDGITYFKLRSLLHSDGVDEYSVNKFLFQVFKNDVSLPWNICSLVKESASQKFDMKEEVMLTILTYLELGEVQYLRLLPQLNTTCSLHFHETSPVLLSSKDILVAAILKMSETKQGHYLFDIPTIANSIQITMTELLNRLQNLKSIGEISYEMKDPAFCFVLMKSPEDLCCLATHITRWLSEVESCKVRKLDAMFSAAMFTAKDCSKVDGCSDSLHTSCLQKRIFDYFRKDHDVDSIDLANKMGASSPFLRADIKVFLQSNSHAKFTPRAVARIMHGISSPAFPLATWSKSHFWGRYSQIDFLAVKEAAKLELMNSVRKETI